ncbi:toll/interleukin-1 receptor domain-containing protein [Micromonospora sp. NBC_01412]|uniref:toll/interleukin-1 receptor domain-containing protein n=1 Tax=Micromonospora sp. NBC_01412 TaxID=2903590 RepID=UPI0032519E40
MPSRGRRPHAWGLPRGPGTPFPAPRRGAARPAAGDEPPSLSPLSVYGGPELPCHAWGDRLGAAKELHDLLESLDVTVWFSEKDVGLGKSLVREIDKGLRQSRIGIVLVTPALFTSLEAEGVADKELSALLATDRVIPVVHGTTFEALRDVSPLLAARSGLSTEASSLEAIAAKIADTVRV